MDTKDVDAFLEHHGVKGMHWGVRRAEAQAKSDAREHVRAKLFYGEGAGTRRKLIKAKVAERSKNPVYKAAFERHVAGQNLEKATDKAIRERHRKDTTKFVSKTARGVHRSISGGFGPVTATSATIAALALAAHRSGADKVLVQKASKLVNNRSTQEATKAWLRSQGLDVH